MANTFNAAQIIGKTLYAFADVNLTRQPMDGAAPIFKVKGGAPVGVVYSFLLPKEGRRYLWWVFKDANGREYYAEHKVGKFDFQALKDQGAKDTETIIKEAEQAAQPAREFWGNKIVLIAGLALAAYLFKEPIAKIFKR